VCCSGLQWVAVCCSGLQCVAVGCSVLQCVAVGCSVLQCVAVGCSRLQWVAVQYRHDDTVSRGGVLLCGCIARLKHTARHDDTVRPRMEKSHSCCPRTA